jgi:small subunit ribosomal protein S1
LRLLSLAEHFARRTFFALRSNPASLQPEAVQSLVLLEPGLEGLVHISEMSWTKRISHPNELVHIDDEIEVVVLGINKEKQEISLGMKQTQANPWDKVAERYPPGTLVKGTVRNLTNYGAFIEIEEGIDGLLHISDMSWTRNVGHPSEILRKGQDLETQILNLDRENKRISLGLKQVQPDPWTTVAQRYPMGSRVTGKIVRLTDFGAFVELEAGVDGLLHISQMSSRPIGRPDELVSVGDELTLLVIRVDPNERRIGLSLKELAHAIEPPKEMEGERGSGRRGKRGGKHRDDYDYDDEE